MFPSIDTKFQTKQGSPATMFLYGLIFALSFLQWVEGQDQTKTAVDVNKDAQLSFSRYPNKPSDSYMDDTLALDLDGFTDEDSIEDYIDFDKLLNEDEDYPDEIDDINEDGSTGVTVNAEKLVDASFNKKLFLRRFQGKTRIQRLSIVNSDFAFNLYRSVSESTPPGENLLLAPLGISSTLGMISLGANGGTHEEIYRALGFESLVNSSSKYNISTVHKLFHRLNHRLFRHNFGYTLKSASALYLQRRWPLLPSYQQCLRKTYFAEAHTVDFKDPATVQRISHWVSSVTKGTISDAVTNIDPSTVFLVINSVYFKGPWEIKFSKHQTSMRSFRLNDKESVKVQMMQTKASFLVTTDHELGCDILQLAYQGNVSMILAVPHKLKGGLKTLERALSFDLLEKWLQAMTNRTRDVIIPKFNLQQKYDLKNNLKEMGVTELFQANADLSGMTGAKDVQVSSFQHQGFIKIDEEGSEAAAVTTVGFTPLTSHNRFVADRPFVFIVYEHHTMSVLFLGQVSNPAKN
ncbi:heparin cofactor 2-like isoform X1 [Lethenteron reissneri]|uniref:heparin cofactor 2-like isoform X1 n=2 Tax=Lethenteron reissneri TaxID=7753 RepID=UPI002AB63645|nr:heparin cofactor 2-like isoform X1 [Lethenteron reissneri]